jgi:hypothetical protein
MRVMIVSLAVLLAVAGSASAQVKQQVFAGAGVTVPRNAGAASTSVNGGYALIVPLADGWAVRPLVSVARVNPTTAGRASFPSLLAAALVIRRVTPTFSLLAGGGMNTVFPPNGTNQRLATLIVSTNSRISARWVMLTPVVITETGIGCNTQFAFAW